MTEEMTPDVSTSEVADLGGSVDHEVNTGDSDSGVAASSEKMVPQSHVNKLIGKIKLQEQQRANAYLEQLQQQQRQQLGNIAPGSGDTTAAGAEGQDADLLGQINAYIDQRVEQKSSAISEANVDRQIGMDFGKKIHEAMIDDPEFAELYDDLQLDPSKSPIDYALIKMTAPLENTASIMKELAQFPEKLSDISNLLREGKSALAQKTLKRLSDSIKANQEAKGKPQASAPLDQLRPSTLGTSDGSVASGSPVSSYKSLLKRKGY